MRITDALALSRLILRFGQVYRITLDREGRPESDTTHTLMLALLAGSLAEEEVIPLDRALVVHLALVHDLVEAYAGDTPTLRALGFMERFAKEARERDALRRLREDLAGLPWVLDLLETYEAQACPEAHFVRYLDKVLPKLSHRDNGCAAPRQDGMTLPEFTARHRQQGADLAARYPDFVAVRDLFEAACRDAEDCWGASVGGEG